MTKLLSASDEAVSTARYMEAFPRLSREWGSLLMEGREVQTTLVL